MAATESGVEDLCGDEELEAAAEGVGGTEGGCGCVPSFVVARRSECVDIGISFMVGMAAGAECECGRMGDKMGMAERGTSSALTASWGGIGSYCDCANDQICAASSSPTSDATCIMHKPSPQYLTIEGVDLLGRCERISHAYPYHQRYSSSPTSRTQPYAPDASPIPQTPTPDAPAYKPRLPAPSCGPELVRS